MEGMEGNINSIIDFKDAVAGFNIGNISSPIKSITSGIAGIKLMINPNILGTSSGVSSAAEMSPTFLPPALPSARVLAIKRGFRSIRTPRTCGVSFEALPVWLWTLRPKEWSQIFITGPDEARLHQVHPELRDILVEKFTIVMAPPVRDSRCSLADVWWVSGRDQHQPFKNWWGDERERVVWGEGLGSAADTIGFISNPVPCLETFYPR
jgi:hypothetical protein